MLVRRAVLLLLLLLLLLLAVPATLMVLNVSIDLGPFKKIVTDMASEELGLDVSIDGETRLVLGVVPTFHLQGLEITDSRHAGNEQSVSLGLARVRVDLVSLLFRSIRIEELTAEDVRVVAVMGRDGETPAAPEEAETVESAIRAPATESDEAALIFDGLADLALRRIFVDIRDVDSGRHHRFVLDEMRGGATAFEPLSLQAHGTYQEQPFRIEMRGETVDKILLLKWSWPLEMSAEVAGMRVELVPAGQGPAGSADEGVHYKLSVSGNRFDDLDAIAGVSLPPLGPYAFSGRFSVFRERVSIADLAVSLGNSNLNGSFDLDATRRIPRFEIDLTAEAVHLEDFDSGDWSPTEGSPDSKSVAESDRKTDTAADADPTGVVAAFDPELLKSFSARLKVAVTKVESKVRKLGSGSLELRVEDGIINLDPLIVEFPRGPVELAMVIDPTSRTDANMTGLLPVSLSAKVADTQLRFDKAVDHGAAASERPPEIRYHMNVRGKRLDSLDAYAGVSLPPLGPYELDTLISVAESRYALNDLDIRIGDSDLKGRMLLTTSGERPRAEVNLTTDVLQLDDFIFEDWSMTRGDVEAEVKDDEAGVETDSSAEIDQDQVTALLSPETMTLIDAWFSLDVAKVLLGSEHMGSGKIAISLEDGRLVFSPVRLAVPGGSMDMRFALEPIDEDMLVELAVNIEHFDYGVLARRENIDSEMDGRLSVNLDLESRADTPENLLRNANGHMLLGIWPNDIEADVFDLWTVNLLIALAPTVDEGPSSKLNCVITGLEFNDGIATQTSLLMDTTNMQVGGEIKADFKNEKIYVFLRPRAKVPQFFSLATPVEVDGNFSDFGLSPAPGALIGTVIRMVASIVTVPVARVFREEIPEDGESACAIAYQGGIPDGR